MKTKNQKLRHLLFFLPLLILFGCSSSDEPAFNYNLTINSADISNVDAVSATIIVSASSIEVTINELGVRLSQGEQIIAEYEHFPTDGSISNKFDGLTPNTKYNVEVYAKYTNPVSKKTEIKSGTSKSFKTEECSISLSNYSYSGTGECEARVSCNYEKIDEYTLTVSPNSDFSTIAFEQSYKSDASYAEEKFTLSQGKYYARVSATNPYSGETLISDTKEYYVVTSRGTIINEGFVDLGLGTLWSAKCYTEGEGSNKKYLFPVATVNRFDDIKIYDDTFTGTEYDYLTSTLGLPYRTPTNEEYKRLKSLCMWESSDDGFIVTGCTGNAILIPYTYGSDKGTYYFGTSTLATVCFIWSYHLKKNDAKYYLSEWPYSHPRGGYVIYPVCTAAD